MLKLKSRAGISSSLSLVFSGMIASAAYAQVASVSQGDQAVDPTSDAAAPGDIVVTATRRGSVLSNVPISVVAETQSTLDQKGVKDFASLSKITPGLQFDQQINNRNTITIRGIQSDVGASTTGLYIDDTPIQARQIGAGNSSGTAVPNVFDLERVEVLRGPQGTLFGAGSEGGTVRFISPDPSLTTYSTYSRGEIAFTDDGSPSYEAGSAVGGPIAEDKLGFRASAYIRRQGGWVDRKPFNVDSSSDNENTSRSIVLRAALKWKPVDAVTVTPSVLFQDVNNEGSSVFERGVGIPAEFFTNVEPIAGKNKDRFVLPALKVEVDLGPVELTSNTSYFDRRQHQQSDYSLLLTSILSRGSLVVPPVNDFQAASDFLNEQKSFTQEVRLQSVTNGWFNYVFGAFYQHAKQTSRQRVPWQNPDSLTNALFGINAQTAFGIPSLPADPATYFQAPLAADLYDEATDKQLAGFGQVDLKPLDWLTLTAGLRVAEIKFDFANRQSGPLAGGTSSASGGQSETAVTPKFALAIRPARGQLIYASAAKGFRPGGGNPPVPLAVCSDELSRIGLSQSPTNFESDHLWSYEVGAKSRLFSNKVNLSASGFYIDWQNIQRQISLTCGFAYVTNVASATSKGFDFQIDVSPTEGLLLTGSAAYTHAAFNAPVFGGVVNAATGERSLLSADNDRLPMAPWTVYVAANYEFPVGGKMAYARADYNYRSSYQAFPGVGTASYDPVINRLPAQNKVSVRTGLRFDGFDISVFADNLTNDKAYTYFVRQRPIAPVFFASAARPRTIGLTVTLHR